MENTAEILVIVVLGLFMSIIFYHIFMLAKERIDHALLSRWAFLQTSMYQNEETGDVIVVTDEEMKLIKSGQHKGQYVKVKEEGKVYFYDKIIEKD